jgi:hypothetical protein
MESYDDKKLLEALAKNIDKLSSVKDITDISHLESLMLEHNEIVSKLKEADLSPDPKLQELLIGIGENISTIVTQLSEVQKKTGEKLKSDGNRQRLNKAYGK